MGKLHDTYQLTITTLSPLHIGTGSTLLRDYDYVIHRGKTWVLDTEAMAEMLYDQSAAFKKMIEGRPASELLSERDYDENSRLFRYVMSGEPRSTRQGAELQEQLKDGYSRPYIPGSSLKGALRTALAFVGWHQRTNAPHNLNFDPRMLDNNPKFAGRPMEQKVLYGLQTEPNYDLLRILQVSDSSPDDQRRLRLLNVQVIAGSKPGSPVELEAIPRDVTFTAALSLDGYLQQGNVAQQLGWSKDDQLRWIRRIPEVVKYFTGTRLDAERKRWRDTPGQLRSFYVGLYNRFAALDAKTEFLLQLGWGGGWDSKTFGEVLTGDSDKFYQVVKKYGTFMDRQKSFKPGDRFPKSRRLVVREGVPVQPLGWLHVKMERL